MSAYQTILASPEMTSSYVAAVVITGLAVVFACLIILVLFLYLMGVVFNKDKRNKKDIKVSRDDIKSNDVKSVKTSHESEPIQKGISGEVVAAISAAIAMIGESVGKKLTIKGITRASKRGVNSWAQAGKIDNTRPF